MLVKNMTTDEIKTIMHERIAAVWRERDVAYCNARVLTGLWDVCEKELRRRGAYGINESIRKALP